MLKRLSMAVIFMLCAIFMLFACESDSADTSPAPEAPADKSEELIIPSEGDFDLDGISFSEISYSRPDTSALILSIEGLTADIKDGLKSSIALISKAYAVRDEYKAFRTMMTYVDLMCMIDTSNSFYQAELEFFDASLPVVEEKYGDLLSAAASSENFTIFGECFGHNTLQKHLSLATETDKVSDLRKTEAELCEQYIALASDAELSKDEQREQLLQIFIRLLEVRSTIAGELGYANYADYVYSTGLTDYSSDKLNRVYGYIANYIVPVYNKLASRVLNSNSRHPVDPHTREKLLNRLLSVFSELDGEIGDIYSYMLYHGLFNVEAPRNGRIPATVTAYLPAYKSPFLYATLKNSLTDYMLICREFGYFYDYFVAGGAGRTSNELSKSAAQSMELLALHKLKGALTSKEYKYISCMEYEQIILTIINNSLYSKFEHIVYSIPYHEISADSINAAAEEAILAMGISKSAYSDPEDLIVADLILDPFSVQSYVSSSFVSLEIYFEEIQTEGKGLAIYKSLVYRSGEVSLSEFIDRVGIRSPFDEDTVKFIADSLHYVVLGSHYFEDGGGEDTASIASTQTAF